MMNISELPLNTVAERCQKEHQAFIRRKASDERYCFELFRRALAVQQEEALAYVRRIYNGYLLNWVYGHTQFALVDEQSEYFCEVAFENFYFAMRDPAKFNGFSDLPSVLRYLKSCVFTAIAGYARRADFSEPLTEEIHEIPDTDRAHDGLTLDDLWKRIESILIKDDDRLLARCIFEFDMKPQEIAEQYGHIWKNAHTVSSRIYIIKTQLRNDPILRHWFDPDEDDED